MIKRKQISTTWSTRLDHLSMPYGHAAKQCVQSMGGVVKGSQRQLIYLGLATYLASERERLLFVAAAHGAECEGFTVHATPTAL